MRKDDNQNLTLFEKTDSSKAKPSSNGLNMNIIYLQREIDLLFEISKEPITLIPCGKNVQKLLKKHFDKIKYDETKIVKTPPYNEKILLPHWSYSEFVISLKDAYAKYKREQDIHRKIDKVNKLL